MATSKKASASTSTAAEKPAEKEAKKPAKKAAAKPASSESVDVATPTPAAPVTLDPQLGESPIKKSTKAKKSTGEEKTAPAEPVVGVTPVVQVEKSKKKGKAAVASGLESPVPNGSGSDAASKQDEALAAGPADVPHASASASKDETSSMTSTPPKPATEKTSKTDKAKAAAAPKPVKLLKAPAVNKDDPFDGIDELSEGQFLWQQREVLLAEKAQYMEQSRMLRAEADQLAADMEPGDVQFDDESGEGAGVSVERERDLAMSAHAALSADETDRAIRRVESGIYGFCETCSKPIARARLRAMPSALQCVSCKNGGLSRR